MMPNHKKSAKDVMKPHSEAKVSFYQKYLVQKLRVLSQVDWVKDIHVYDLFCGRGVYDDGKLGSALRSYQTICQTRQNYPSDKRFVLHLNDRNPRHVESVRAYIESIENKDVSMCEVQYTCEDANAFVERIIAGDSKKKRGVQRLFFIDPYGYKQVKRKMLEGLMKMGGSEILLFMPISFMQRFTRHAFSEEATPGSQPLKNMLEEFFPVGHPIMKERVDVQTYIDYLTEAFSFDGRYYTTSYPIERNVHNQFALFFLSSSTFDFQEILKIKWKLIDQWGVGFHQSCEETLFGDHFKQERINEYMENFRVKLILFLENGRTNDELYNFALKNGFRPQQVKDLLRKLQWENLLEIVDVATGEVIMVRNKFYVDYKCRKKAIYRFELKERRNAR